MEGLDWAKRLNKKAYLHVSLLPPSLWSKKSDLFYSAFFGGTHKGRGISLDIDIYC